MSKGMDVMARAFVLRMRVSLIKGHQPLCTSMIFRRYGFTRRKAACRTNYPDAHAKKIVCDRSCDAGLTRSRDNDVNLNPSLIYTHRAEISTRSYFAFAFTSECEKLFPDVRGCADRKCVIADRNM